MISIFVFIVFYFNSIQFFLWDNNCPNNLQRKKYEQCKFNFFLYILVGNAVCNFRDDKVCGKKIKDAFKSIKMSNTV